MSNFPYDFNLTGRSAEPVSPVSEIRRDAPSQDFRKTMEAMRTGMELAMANRFLEQSLMADNADGGGQGGFGSPMAGFGGPMGGMGGLLDSRMQMNSLLTMAAMHMGGREALPVQPPAQAPAENPVPIADLDDPGALSSRFESGLQGPAAVGYDRMGGTSYGTYQISSAQGTFDAFLRFLDEKSPELAERLRAAGPADTGSTNGRLPDVWRAVAGEMPEEFAALQREFVELSHYRPALSGILERLDLSEAQLPKALREVIFSTAVQHGPSGAQSIFARVAERLQETGGAAFFRQLIDSVYDERGNHFGGSTERVRDAVLSRFTREKALALASLDSEFSMPGSGSLLA
ncbi:hypothetical protein dsat_1823 [Alkalidesulfovibrio alkalitolerans DSM 16529]|uniref:Type VI secretion system spike protein VgrG3-like C-terminal domain-containing protein n=1 Tax=Alkalidesulfovibrio alkalitolerans DSM 16529 TaxID=1121439 RepID=S7UP03_9BACT|nr:hypothetical protein [Alkalidesulfovibrio alkalitolerans]EPR35719.1 hypothetical protein dsat_1823 [Alkalidesulfovibrio alkalitolerans DSM 16529]